MAWSKILLEYPISEGMGSANIAISIMDGFQRIMGTLKRVHIRLLRKGRKRVHFTFRGESGTVVRS